MKRKTRQIYEHSIIASEICRKNIKQSKVLKLKSQKEAEKYLKKQWLKISQI